MPLPIERSPVITKPPIWPVADAVRATAQLAAEAVDEHDAHLLAVLLVEERVGAFLDRLGHAHVARRDGAVVAHDAAHLGLDRALLVVGQRPIAVVVEAQVVGRHQRTSLARLVADRVAQRAVQQVRARVIAHRPRAPLGVDLGASASRRRRPGRADVPRWTISPGTGFCVSSTVKTTVPSSVVSTPRSPTWPPPSA